MHVTAALSESVSTRREVCASTERTASACEDDNFDIIISIGDVQCSNNFVHHAPCKRIQLVWSIQSDCGDAIFNVEENILKIHTTTLAIRAYLSVVRLDVEELTGGNTRTDAASSCTND